MSDVGCGILDVNAIDVRLLQLSPDDNIAVARQALAAGESIAIGGIGLPVPRTIPTGHKIAIRLIAAGEKVYKYGAPIGTATCAIQPGEYVHTHNLQSDYLPTYTLK